MMKWFRFYSEAVNDPKVQRLPGELFKFWVNLLCLANNADERGVLPASAEDIAWALRLDPDLCRANLHTLQGQGLLDWGEQNNSYRPHNWDERQKASDDVTARVNKFREKSNVSGAPSNKEGETLHETEMERFSNVLEENRGEENRVEGEEKAAQAPARPTRKTLSSHPLPPDFAITDAMRRTAKEKHISDWIDIDKHTIRFIAYWTIGEGAGRTKKNWEQAWLIWMTDEAERAEARGVRRNGHNGNGGVSDIGADWPDDNHSFDKDEEGHFIHLAGTIDGRLPYGAKSDAEVQELHKARFREETKRRLQRGAS